MAFNSSCGTICRRLGAPLYTLLNRRGIRGLLSLSELSSYLEGIRPTVAFSEGELLHPH